jgi:DNA-binding MarR family transcriptional regulator
MDEPASLDGPPWVSVGFTLSQLGLETARQFGQVVGAIGIEPRHFAVLRAVQQSPDQSQQGIGDGLGIPASTMVTIVDQLEERGLIERRLQSADRRTRALRLTTAGEAVYARALDAAKLQEARICAQLSPEEREQLLELLGKVRTSLGVAASTVPDRGSGGQLPQP